MIREVELLFKIWQSLDIESQGLLKEDFTVIKNKLIEKQKDELLTSNNKRIAKEKECEAINNRYFGYKYLQGLDDECLEFVLYVLEEKKFNLYHSVMAWHISYDASESPLDFYERYVRKYGEERPYIMENKRMFIKLITFCKEKLWLRHGGEKFTTGAEDRECNQAVEKTIVAKKFKYSQIEESVEDETVLSVSQEKFEYDGKTYYYYKNEFFDDSFISLSESEKDKVANAYFNGDCF